MAFAPAAYIKKDKEKGNVSYIVLLNSEVLRLYGEVLVGTTLILKR